MTTSKYGASKLWASVFSRVHICATKYGQLIKTCTALRVLTCQNKLLNPEPCYLFITISHIILLVWIFWLGQIVWCQCDFGKLTSSNKFYWLVPDHVHDVEVARQQQCLKRAAKFEKPITVGIWNLTIWNPDFLKVKFQMVRFLNVWAFAMSTAIVNAIRKPDHLKSRHLCSDFKWFW